MRKLLLAVTLSLGLAGCAGFTQKLENAYSVVTSATVTPTQIIVAGNTFVALESTATNYLLYCKSTANASQPCALGNRKAVVKAVRAGRAALNALEPYVSQGKAGPSAVFDALVTAITTLQNTNMATGG